MNSETMNHGLAMKPRKYSDILVGQCEIGNIIRVNRKNDEYTISNKTFDFSGKTINELRDSGVGTVRIYRTSGPPALSTTIPLI
jgi:NTE family protein